MCSENFSWRVLSHFFDNIGCVIQVCTNLETENELLAISSDGSLVGFGWTEQDMSIIFYEASSSDIELANSLAGLFSVEVFHSEFGVWIRFSLDKFEEHMTSVKI